MWGQKKPIHKAKGTATQWSNTNFKRPKKGKPVTWVDPEREALLKKLPDPAPYRAPYVDSALLQRLIVGTAVATRTKLAWDHQGVHPFKVLDNCHGPTVFPTGTIMIYSGTVHSTERISYWGTQNAKDVQVLKHTFITSQGRCIINDVNMIEPI